MKKFIQDGDVIQFTAAEDLSSGEYVQIGDRVGMAEVDIANTEYGSVRLKGVVNGAKTSGQAWTVGQKLYMNTSTKALTNVATAGYPFAGTCTEAALSAATEGKCLLSDSSKQSATIAAVATADGSDAATTQALANALKASHNDLIAKLKASGLISNS
jgi:predicted RecA/RadA family phage recombinase